MDYKKAGVDIGGGIQNPVRADEGTCKKTMRRGSVRRTGRFSGAFSLAKIKTWRSRYSYPVPMAAAPKVKLAIIMDKHDTIGIDAVAMCVNDIACAGGEPLFFLDYIACGKDYPEKIADIVKGVAEGCLPV